MIDRLPELVNGDESLVRRGRLLSTTFLVGVDDTEWLVTIAGGRVERVERGPFLLRAWSFAVRASSDAWRRFWESVPAPGYHDIFAMKKAGHLRIEGDLVTLMQHLRYVKDVLAAPRRLATRASRAPAVRSASRGRSALPQAGPPEANGEMV